MSEIIQFIYCARGDIKFNKILISFPKLNQDEAFTLLNLSEGIRCNIIGSIVVTLPNRTSGI